MSHARMAAAKSAISGGSMHIALANFLFDGMAPIWMAEYMAHVSTSRKAVLTFVRLPSGVPRTTTTGVFLYSASAWICISGREDASPSDSVGSTNTVRVYSPWTLMGLEPMPKESSPSKFGST